MLNESDLERYASQLIMPAIEEEGQSILLKSKVLIIGAGGLGNPTAIFCSAAGIGNIDICDHDNIELSNLNRQIAFTVNNLGLSKSIKLKDYCLNLNPNLKINSIIDSFDKKLLLSSVAMENSIRCFNKTNSVMNSFKGIATLVK